MEFISRIFAFSNSDDQRTSCTEANGDVVSYGYDGQLHLTSESRTGTNSYTITYAVDGVGNRTSQTSGGTTTTFTYDADDELTATSGAFTNSYGYNANGDQTTRTLSGTSHTLTYDYDDQLLSTGTGGSTFTYDALGRRYSRYAASYLTKFQYDGTHVLLERQGTGTSATYSYGNALLRKDGETPLFDGQGSERTVTNSSQAVTGALILSAFGQTVATSGSSSSSYMYGATSGYRTDGDVGLMQVGARYYDAQVGRFITRDTDLTQIPYVYCVANPVNAADPTGHGWEDVLVGVGVVLFIGGAIVGGGALLAVGIGVITLSVGTTIATAAGYSMLGGVLFAAVGAISKVINNGIQQTKNSDPDTGEPQ